MQSGIVYGLLGYLIALGYYRRKFSTFLLSLAICFVYGGAIWGVLGMVISVPITSIMVIILSQFPNTRPVAILLSEKGDVTALIED